MAVAKAEILDAIAGMSVSVDVRGIVMRFSKKAPATSTAIARYAHIATA